MKTEFFGDSEYPVQYWELEVGQLWVAQDDFTLEILDITSDSVLVRQVESEETYEHELTGSHSFPDFLFWNNYDLKP